VERGEVMDQTCGNCSHWDHAGSGTFEQRLKARFAEPVCKITNIAMKANEPGCLIHKEASEEHMKERGKEEGR